MKRPWIQWGWLISSLGGTLWLMPFGALWLLHGHFFFGTLALAICFFALPAIWFSAPWKYPNTTLWKLLLIPYAFFLVSVLLLLAYFEHLNNMSQLQYGAWLIPCFTPFFTLGYKTWNSFTPHNSTKRPKKKN